MYIFFFASPHSVVTAVEKKTTQSGDAKSGREFSGPSLTLTPTLTSTFADPLLAGPSSWNTGGIDIRDQSKIAGAKSLTAETRYACSLEREV